ncbi:MAG: hypothetical protein WA002_07090 [Candidatus Acidiferrales bacterium]
MKKILLGAGMVFTLSFAAAGPAKAQSKPPILLLVAPGSTVPNADLLKNLDNKCSNVGITLDPKKSDFMLQAFGWSGNYRFTVFRHGGQAVFSTKTVMLSNAVKDVCRYISAPK